MDGILSGRVLKPKSNLQNVESPSHVVQEQPFSTKPAVKPSRQRFKPQLSCTLCRTRKLKCDRGNPCDNCIKRDLAASCTFVHAAVIRSKPTQAQKAVNGPNQKDIQDRIRHLEGLVVSLMEQQPSNTLEPVLLAASDRANDPAKPLSVIPAATEGSMLVDESSSLGLITIEDNQSKYIGGSHWAAILDSISGLKDSTEYKEWSKEETEKYFEPKNSGPALLVGSIRKATRAEILASIPPKSTVDNLISKLFDGNETFPAPIHRHSFEREYEQFWKNPNGSSITWIGLLYSIMCLSVNKQLVLGAETSHVFPALLDIHTTRDLFSEKTVQCLILGNYVEPSKYTMETLLTYICNEHMANPESQVGTWMLLGLVVRAGLRLGYHRDPSHYPKISVFQGEIQRRLWQMLLHLDLVFSYQVGLPRMITEAMHDAKAPRNLLDSDFDEDTDVLPPSRPYEDFTPQGFLLLTHNVTVVFAKIVDQTNSTTPPSYDEVMRLDKLLHETYAQIPDKMKVRSLEDLKTGSPDLIVGIFAAEILFQKGRCVLHRKFLVSAKSSLNAQYMYSIKTCVDSAMAILKRQEFVWEETQPGGPLYEHKWKCTTMLGQDFLLAAMLICLYLSNCIDASDVEPHMEPKQGQNNFSVLWTKDEMVEALESSYRIWDTSKNTSKQALKAARALKAILAKAKKATVNQGPQTPLAPSNVTSYQYQAPNHHPHIPSLSESTASSPWISDSSNSFQYIPQPGNGADASYPVVDVAMNAPMEFDWNLFDTHFHPNSNLGLTPPEFWNNYVKQDNIGSAVPASNMNLDLNSGSWNM